MQKDRQPKPIERLAQDAGKRVGLHVRSWAGIGVYHCCLMALSFGVVTAFRFRHPESDRSHRSAPLLNGAESHSPHVIPLSQASGVSIYNGGNLNNSELAFQRLDELLKRGSQSSLAEAGCIVCSLASKDPERVLAHFLEQDWANIPISLKTLLVDAWAEKSYENALVAIQGCGDKEARFELECRLLHSLSRIDPQRAFEIWNFNSENLDLVDEFRTLAPEYEIFNNWARTDTRSAISAIEEIKEKDKQDSARRAFVVGLSSVDLDEAIQYIKSFTDARLQRDLLLDCLTERRKLEPVSTFTSVAEIHAMLDNEDADRFLEDAAPLMIRGDSKGGLVSLLTLGKSSDQMHETIERALTEVGMTSAQSVVGALEEVFPDLKKAVISLDSNSRPFLVAYLSAVAGMDPEKGLELLKRNPEIYQTASNAVLSKVFERDPEGAMGFLAGRIEGERGALATRLLVKWNDSSPEKAIEWARQYMPSDSTVAQDLYLTNLSPLIAENPAQYADSLAEIAPVVSRERASAYWTLVSSWVDKNPEEAAAWVSNLEDDDIGTHMIDALTRKWTRTNPLAASGWIRSLPPGKGRDIAIRNLIDEIREADPKSAGEWSKLIGSEPQ